MTSHRILLVEDEPGMLMTIQDRLMAARYTIDTAVDGRSALGLFPSRGPQCPFDLVVLDIMLPDIDGFEVCRQLRARGFALPVLMLTARNAVEDRVKGLKIGADDYLPKPFSMAELTARIEALFRRSLDYQTKSPPAEPEAEESASPYTFGRFAFDAPGRLLIRSETDGSRTELALNPTEFRLLSLLVTHPGVVLSREELLDGAWGYNNEVTSRTVDVHIAWLRQKLSEPTPPRHIQTIRGGGYKFVP